MKYDIIVIGSGFGGLVSGAILSKAGLTVGVLEKSGQPGGCIQSYRRGDMNFDTGLHYIGGLGPGHSLHSAFVYLGLMDLPWKRMDEHYDHVMIGGREFLIAQGEDSFVDSLSEDFPFFRDELRMYVDKLHNITPEDMDVSAWHWLKDNLHDDMLIDVISAPSMKMELRRESLPLFSFLHSQKSYMESSWRLCGDGNMIVDRLVTTIHDGGGDVIPGSEVVNMMEGDEGIISVLCSDGREYSADYFISDIHPSILCSMLSTKPRRNRVFIKRMRSCENTFGMFTTSVVLKPETLRYFNYNAYIYDKGVWGNDIGTGEVNGVMVSCRCPVAESEYARQIDLLTPMTWKECRQWEDTKVGHRGEAYRRMCDAKAKESIRLAERFIPSLGDMVDRLYTSSPLTYRDYLSSPEGTAFGIRKDYRKSMLTFHSVKTPVSNLMQTGQNIGLSGIEGVTMTAFETCRHIMGNKYIDGILNQN